MARPNTPPGTSIRLDLPFNGNGVLEVASLSTGKDAALDVLDMGCNEFPEFITLNCSCWLTGYKTCPATAPLFCRQCTKDWPKPIGYGSNRMPATLPTSWATTLLRKDPRVRPASDRVLPPRSRRSAFALPGRGARKPKYEAMSLPSRLPFSRLPWTATRGAGAPQPSALPQTPFPQPRRRRSWTTWAGSRPSSSGATTPSRTRTSTMRPTSEAALPRACMPRPQNSSTRRPFWDGCPARQCR
jgi:hypothetical protein